MSFSQYGHSHFWAPVAEYESFPQYGQAFLTITRAPFAPLMRPRIVTSHEIHPPRDMWRYLNYAMSVTSL